VLFALRDGATIESVLMAYETRRTACISTQVGCGMGCVFCATGQDGYVRNLTAGEILGQVLYFAREVLDAGAGGSDRHTQRKPSAGHPNTNVVLMGMGEPLANYAATWQAIETLADARGFHLGARRITLSTVGLVPGIQRMATEELPVNLAISLHAAEDGLRGQLAPINARYPLSTLMAAVRGYIEKTGRRVTFEYALISGVNDSPEQSRQLVTLLRGVLCHVNLIPLNQTRASPLRPSSRDKVESFRQELEAAGIPTTVRLRRGIEIEAGCGQLRQRHLASTASERVTAEPWQAACSQGPSTGAGRAQNDIAD
jgi:23S rRNA (adenine2503-C2)-methyltransferase